MLVLSQDEQKLFYNRTLGHGTATGNFHHCILTKDCTGMVETDADVFHCICPVCDKNWCHSCGVEWHQGATCQQYQEWRVSNAQGDSKLDELLADRKWKKCPHCNVPTEKTGGCNHITCTNCSNHWCYLCRAKMDAGTPLDPLVACVRMPHHDRDRSSPLRAADPYKHFTRTACETFGDG